MTIMTIAEVAGALCLVAGSYLLAGLPAGIVALGAVLLYEAKT